MDRVLVVDDEKEMLDVCRDILRSMNVDVVTESNPLHAIARLESERFDLAIVDIRMPEADGLEVLRQGRSANPDMAVLLMTAFPTDATIERSVMLGATGYVTKPFSPEQLRAAVARARLDRRLRFTSQIPENTRCYEGMFGSCEEMRKVYSLIEQVASADVDVLVTGESGVGKELVARALHNRGARARGRFFPVDCGASPENLLESELFGHEKGAYTGAVASSRGLVEFAHKGTLFLDEVAELSLALQVKLLRMLQERCVKRIGGTDFVEVDIRVVAATHRHIDREVAEGRFREDLYYRLNVVRIEVPPLRERGKDVFGLFEHFLAREAPRFGRTIREIEPAVREALEKYPWPGNVREMLNVVRRIL
ncbi:MAG: sigma-54-dependent Fis family transcriptional regulator, partial [Planctomycetes bacterium]|nr:sigma-54-dependent Fis family transcriptional regulator [Planctomycetota bacterium]